MNAYLTILRDVVFVFTTLEVSTILPNAIADGQVDVGYRKATVEAADEISYEWPHGSFW